MAGWDASARFALHTCKVCVSVVTSEGGSDALPTFRGPAKGGPICVVAGLTQAGANRLHKLMDDDGDEWVALGWDGLVVTDRTPAGFGFQGRGDRFDTDRGDMGAPQGGLVPVGPVGGRYVHG